MADDRFKALIYLWTRDASLDVSADTEAYIMNHVDAMNRTDEISFSNSDRAALAEKLASKLKDNHHG